MLAIVSFTWLTYEMSCKVETTEKKDPIKQLKAITSSIKDLLSDFLGFKY